MNTQAQKEKLQCHLASYKMKLTTLSSVFIGGGNESSLNKSQYVYYNKVVSVIDESSLANYLINNKPELFENLVKFVSLPNKSLNEWFENNQLNYKNFIKYEIPVKTEKHDKYLNDLRLFIKDSNNRPYIPGSSIKGAIRTALLFKEIIPENFSDNWNEIKESLKLKDISKINEKINKEISNIENTVFHSLNLTNDIYDPVNSIFRGIQVSDSKSMSELFLKLYKQYDLSTLPSKYFEKQRNKKKYDHYLPLYRECIEPEKSTTINITVDNSIFEKDIDYILDALNEYSVSIYDMDQGLLAKFYNYIEHFNKESGNNNPNIYYPDEISESQKKAKLFPNICLGGGTGSLTKIITYKLAPFEEVKNFMGEYLDIAFYDKPKNKPSHNHKKDDVLITPRTIKLAHNINDILMLGWCNIQEAK